MCLRRNEIEYLFRRLKELVSIKGSVKDTQHPGERDAKPLPSIDMSMRCFTIFRFKRSLYKDIVFGYPVSPAYVLELFGVPSMCELSIGELKPSYCGLLYLHHNNV